MGILAESTTEDVQAIEWVSRACFSAWEEYKKQADLPPDHYIVDLNPAVLNFVSEYGAKILSNFQSPTLLDRIATLIVLANSFQFFTLKERGKPVLGIPERREFFAKLTCAFVNSVLLCFPEQEPGQTAQPRFIGITDPDRFRRYLVLIHRLDTAQIKPEGSPDKVIENRNLQAFVRDTISVENFLKAGIHLYPSESELVIPASTFEGAGPVDI